MFSEAGLAPSSWADLRQRFFIDSSKNICANYVSYFKMYLFYYFWKRIVLEMFQRVAINLFSSICVAIYEEMLEICRFCGGV
jgi:hypothetical protein